MKAEITCVGTELLLGHTVNTDATIIARKLAELGVDLEWIQTVGDNPDRLGEALKTALGRADLVVTSGGLGPTGDDLTKETVARLAGLPLLPDPDSEKALREYFGSRPIGANQFKQILMPKGAAVFKNAVGTAPGCAVPFGGGKYVVVLPGPPGELEPMLNNEVVPFIKKLVGATIHSVQARAFGIGEGAAAEKLAELFDGENPTVATYAGEGEVSVKITAKAESEAEAKKLIEPVLAKTLARIGDFVYGIDTSGLEYALVTELIKRQKTIALAESCTGGLVAKRITDVPGASAVFGYGVVAYANSAKEKALEISAEILARVGAVSPEVAGLMAKNVRSYASADIGVGVTGIAGPDGGTAQKPVGLVYVGVAFEDVLAVGEIKPLGKYLGRAWTRRLASNRALDLARRLLLGLPVDDLGAGFKVEKRLLKWGGDFGFRPKKLK